MDPNAHQYLRFAFELLSFIGNFVVACIAVVALYQIILAKRALATARDDIELRSKREAVTLAADKCAEFANVTLKDINASFDVIINAKVPLQHWELKNSRFDDTSLEDLTKAIEWEQRLKKSGKQQSASDILNKLEAFAMYFAKGAADEQVAYPATGELFCRYVEYLAPHLIALRNQPPDVISGPFQNILTLYEAWTSRAKKERLQSEAQRINSALAGIHDSDIPPIGTNARFK